ncbi:DUF4097 family beta strand repeat-containing protein [Humibacter ginsenosidimutans]|uniref:DUF4097 family beta strand repeat protein n=1 Tax=Humibacter ginsenosidimutans TaxID=2599293 RepID=A0A5B8M4G7_9MICO|nr:DUF4097 family beta strand repeat-containing protein [Humibacter ginsenosidimutans]QDZ15206.1 DUF4097 family beta strand repeat protein [Humibacter ginsenosidimutans]
MAQERWIVNPGDSKTIDFEVVRKLKVSLIAGRVDVIGHDERTARVEVSNVTGKELKVTIDGDTLEVDHPQWRWDNFIDVFRSWRGRAGADVTILVPRDVELKLGVVSAVALVSGLVTDAKLSTVSGEITTDGIVGDLDLNTVSGELTARDHRGEVFAHTVSGDITVSGSVTKLGVDSVSANIYLDLFGTPFEVKSNSVSGDLTMRLDENVGVRYRINTVSGVAHLDGTTVIKGSMGKTYTSQSGSLDGKWLDVSSSSVSGNISVVRRQPSTSTSAQATDAPATDTAEGAE